MCSYPQTISFYLSSIRAGEGQLLAEMEYCASAASMLAEEFWQIAEGFAEVQVNILLKSIMWKKYLE